MSEENKTIRKGGFPMRECCKCEYSKSFNRLCVGIGASYGSNYVQTEYICKHPKSLDCIVFAGKTSPRNCPLKRKEK